MKGLVGRELRFNSFFIEVHLSILKVLRKNWYKYHFSTFLFLVDFI